MLAKALEWCRIVNAKPTGEIVESRKKAAAELVAQFALSSNRSRLIAALHGVVVGFDSLQQTSPIVQLMIATIQKSDPTLPADLTENSIQLRCCAGIAIGEILSKSVVSGEESGVIAASLLNCGLGIRTLPTQKFLKGALEELQNLADNVLEAASRINRCRSSDALNRLAELESDEKSEGKEDDEETAPGEVVAAVVEAIREVRAAAQADREELEALWWMFTGYSTIANVSLSTLTPQAAALCAALELANMALLPPARSLSAMVQRALSDGRSASVMKSKTIQQVSDDWTETMLLEISSEDPNVLGAIEQHAPLFPTSWWALQLRRSAGATKPTVEFGKKTGISASHAILPSEWAAQIFRERVAQRLLVQGKGE